MHACAHKYSPATSYYDGKERFIEYTRSQWGVGLAWSINWQHRPKVTGEE